MFSAAEIFLLLLLLLLACAVVAIEGASACAGSGGGGAGVTATGGAPHRRAARPQREAASSHLVVDTLNLVHWLRDGKRAGAPVTTAEIVGAIDASAAALRRRYAGTVVYVLKDQESRLNSAATRAL
jgi:hypothetical protein